MSWTTAISFPLETLVLLTLRESGGVIAGAHGAAAKLGMKRTTLQSRMQKLGITREEYEP
jgi:formate hydrogenlyase transcriptional activator